MRTEPIPFAMRPTTERVEWPICRVMARSDAGNPFLDLLGSMSRNLAKLFSLVGLQCVCILPGLVSRANVKQPFQQAFSTRSSVYRQTTSACLGPMTRYDKHGSRPADSPQNSVHCPSRFEGQVCLSLHESAERYMPALGRCYSLFDGLEKIEVEVDAGTDEVFHTQAERAKLQNTLYHENPSSNLKSADGGTFLLIQSPVLRPSSLSPEGRKALPVLTHSRFRCPRSEYAWMALSNLQLCGRFWLVW
jgi:hypothetical protein